jgi:hypothetical protein
MVQEAMNMARPARLTSALLARKGHALPAGGFAQSRLGPTPQPSPAGRETKTSGAAAPRAARSSELIRRGAAQPNRTPERAGAERIAVTVRLDRKRYRRLKSLAARSGRSGQEILVAALDAYFEAGARDRAHLPGPARRRNR